MRALELFSGTGSVGEALIEKGYEVVSVDISAKYHTPTHLADVMAWDFKQYPPDHFDLVWASPPCTTFSKCRLCWIGRKSKSFGDKIITREMITEDEIKVGVPVLRKAEEIIAYFNPRRWVIENPAGGRMKNYISQTPFTVDYCRFSDWGYNKPTHIWTNKTDFVSLRCAKDCENMADVKGKKLHRSHLGGSHWVEEDGKLVMVNTAEAREKYRDRPKVQLQNIRSDLSERYRVPKKLVWDLI